MPIARQGIGLKLLYLNKVKKDVCGSGKRHCALSRLQRLFLLFSLEGGSNISDDIRQALWR